MRERDDDNYFLNGYIIIAVLLMLGLKSLKWFGISINDTLHLVLLVAFFVFLIIGIVKAIRDKMKE
ncbi:MAG: hypothetical protein UH543_08220 [Bacteroidales bacterium]|nr:hypothetical protein [Bacteroidales bacterium]MEE0977713.1 hypothetical protein [Bacteroidales bacterium]